MEGVGLFFAVLVLIGLAIGGIVLVIFGALNFRKWKVMKDTPTSKVVDIEPGRVEVKGVIKEVPGNLQMGPITGKPCIRYEVKVQEYRSNRKNGGHWSTIYHEESGGPFLLKDDSGMVLVDPKGGKLGNVLTLSRRQGLFSDLDPGSRSFLESRNISNTGAFGLLKRTLKVEERIVPNGVNLYVLGDAVNIPQPAEVKDNFLVNPFTIIKKSVMALSYKSEAETSGSLLAKSIIMMTIGGILLAFGVAVGIMAAI